MGRRPGDQQHFQAPAPADKTPPAAGHSKAIGLSARHKDQNPSSARGPSRHQQRIEKAHSRYPFSQGTLWLSVAAFLAFCLAALYWVVYLSSTQP